MSAQITVAFVQQFRSNIQLLLQQFGSRLRGTLAEEPITGDRAYFEQIGPTSFLALTSRHADTPQVDTPHDRRVCFISDYNWADLIDKADRVRILIEPGNAYAQNIAQAYGRLYDDVVLDALDGAALSGVAGGTSNSLAAGNKVAVDYVESGVAANSNLTVAKVRNAAKILNAFENPDEGRIAVINAGALQALQRDDEFTSRDFNTMQPLATGGLPVSWMGFTWKRSERLNTITGNVKSCPFYSNQAAKVGMGMDLLVRISERDDKNYSTQVYSQCALGAVRLQENAVVQVAIDTTL